MIRRSETEHTFALFYLAHADGKITGYHVDHLGNLWHNNPKVHDLLYRDEQMLCDAACKLSPAEFGLACQKWLSLADPDGAYQKYLLNLERRFLASRKDIDGNLHIVGRMDPITGEAFNNLVTRRANELFDEDWAAAKAQAADGEEITKDLPPSPEPPAGPSTGAAVDPNRRCETGQGWPVPWRVMLEQVMTLQIRRVVFGAPSVVLDAGELRRLFSPVQREVIKHRDRCCGFPGGHRDAIYCETDHILAVADGGLTAWSTKAGPTH